MPRVSIGIPVYNAENFLSEALESLLSQTYKNIEFIISDNGSTDSTETICLEAAKRDKRIRYYRSASNQGAAWNFNRVVELARGEYFKWAAHDDLCDPRMIEVFVEALDRHPEMILSYCSTFEIDEAGNRTRLIEANKAFQSQNVPYRVKSSWQYPPQIPVFGLIRTHVLKNTTLVQSYCSADKVLICQLALLGPFYCVSEPLFYYRRHKEQSTSSPYPTHISRIAWYDPRKRGQLTYPHWRLLAEHFKSISRIPVNNRDRVICYLNMLYWIRISWRKLAGNLVQSDRLNIGSKHRLSRV